MVDWVEQKMNHKYWVMIALLQSVSRPFAYCSTQLHGGGGGGGGGSGGNGGGDGLAVYAQGLRSKQGEVVVLINTKSTAQSATLPGAAGKHASGRKSPLATKTLLEDTDGLRRPPLEGAATQSISALSMR